MDQNSTTSITWSKNSSSSEASITADTAIQPLRYGAVTMNTKGTESNTSAQCCSTVLIRHILLFTGLTIGTYIGVSTRIGLSTFSNWDGIIHFPSFWAQIVGTLIIGAATAQKENIQESFSTLYTVITTGICGSMTTFSSWNAEASKVLLQLNDSTLQPVHHSIDGGRIVGFLTVLLLGTGMPVSVFYFGTNISKLLPITSNNLQSNTIVKCLLTLNTRRCWIFPLVTTSACIIISTVIVTGCVFTENYEFLFALLFGGPGTYIRWRLGALDKNNMKFVKNFPFGTFLSNIIGSIILAITLVSISYCSTQIEIGDIPLAVLKGVAVGFCGSITTVSTFVSQLCSLSFYMSVFYASISLVVSQIVFITVFSTYQAIF